MRLVTAPIPQGGRGRGRTKDGTVYYLNQEQVRWIIIQSRTPAGKELARQVLAVFDAWERGELVSRAEAAEAALARQSATMPASVAGHQHYALEQSRFLIEGPAAMVPSDFVASVKADNRFTRIGTALPLTITIVEDQVRIFDVDLGHAIGGECTNLVRPRVREIQSRLRLMRPDPWYEVQACRQLGHSYKMTSGSLLAHKQAKAISTIMDPDSRSEIQYRLDLLCDHFAMGRLSELVYDPPGLLVATGLRYLKDCDTRPSVTAPS